jgi:Na+-driven multidrug efflux pump
VQAFNGAGDTTTPMLVNLASFWCFKIPAAYLLAKVVGLGPRGVFLAITAAYAVQSVTAGLLFRRGRWRRVTIATH